MYKEGDIVEYVIDNDESFVEFKSLLNDGDAKILSVNNNILKAKIYSDVLNIEVKDKYLSQLVVDNTHKVINGKDSTKNIVNISVKDDLLYIFKEDSEGITYTTEKYKHWVLSPKYHSGFNHLKGNQYYKFIQEYSIPEFEKIRSNIYKHGLFTVYNYPEAYMIRNGHTYFKGMKSANVSILSFDIETTGVNPHADDACVLLITNTFRKNGVYTKRTFNISDYYNEIDMIADWVNWVNNMDPSIVCGHNIVMFDIPYIKARADKENLPLHLGRNGIPLEVEERPRELRKDGSQSYTYHRINIFGREIVDTFFLAIKADIGRKYESYGLKAIIKAEGLEKEGRQHYDAGSIKDHWHNPEERKKIIQYAEDDADDPIKLFDLMIAPFFYSTAYVPKPFQMMIESATGSQINSLMIRSYLQDGFSVAKSSDSIEFEGAVSLGNTGIYTDCIKWDVASLYPSIMRQYKIYPKGKDYNENFLKMLEYFTKERLLNKKLAKETGDRFYKDLEQTMKVFINSSYGFMGAAGLNYNYPEGAAEVTKYGREIINRAVEWATGRKLVKVVDYISSEGKETEKTHYKWILGEESKEFVGEGFTLVNGDTDSITVTKNKFIDNTEREFYLTSLNSNFPNMISWEDDGYYSSFIVLRAKNYIMKTEEGKVKLKGSSLKTQQKEPALKEMTDKMIQCLLESKPEDAVNVYNSYIKECLNVIDISRWATKKTVTKAILSCKNNPEARTNETKVYEAIKHITLQEGDKVYLYPAVLNQDIELTHYKNGKTKEKVIKTLGLKRVEDWNKDHDVDKLIDRVYATAEILGSVLPMNQFIDFTLKKNKHLL